MLHGVQSWSVQAQFLEAFGAVHLVTLALSVVDSDLFAAVQALEAFDVVWLLLEHQCLSGVDSLVALVAFVATTSEVGESRVGRSFLVTGSLGSHELFASITSLLEAFCAEQLILEMCNTAWGALFRAF
jgi:hypothetical protein